MIALKMKPHQAFIVWTRTWHTTSKIALRVLAVALPLVLVGCRSEVKEERLPTFPVEGKVTVNGKPEEGVQVVLFPKDTSNPKVRSARGSTNKEGVFRLTTYVTNDGAIAGTFAVTLEYKKLVVSPEGETSVGPNVLPEKYKKPNTTDITFQVKEGTNNIPAIDIK